MKSRFLLVLPARPQSRVLRMPPSNARALLEGLENRLLLADTAPAEPTAADKVKTFKVVSGTLTAVTDDAAPSALLKPVIAADHATADAEPAESSAVVITKDGVLLRQTLSTGDARQYDFSQAQYVQTVFYSGGGTLTMTAYSDITPEQDASPPTATPERPVDAITRDVFGQVAVEQGVDAAEMLAKRAAPVERSDAAHVAESFRPDPATASTTAVAAVFPVARSSSAFTPPAASAKAAITSRPRDPESVLIVAGLAATLSAGRAAAAGLAPSDGAPVSRVNADNARPATRRPDAARPEAARADSPRVDADARIDHAGTRNEVPRRRVWLRTALHAVVAPLLLVKRYASWIALAVVAVICVEVLLFATRRGPGVQGDSVTYLSTAASVASGRGFAYLAPDSNWRSLTQFPPMFPLLLAMGRLAGSATALAHALNVTALIATVLLVGRIVYRFTAGHWTTLAAAATVGLTAHLLGIYAMVYSEPLFVALATLALWLLVARADMTRRRAALIGLIAGTCFLTRYAGAFTIVVSGLGVWLALSLSTSWRKRLITMTCYAVAAAALPGAWLVHNAVFADGMTSRPLGFHPPDGGDFELMFDTLGHWGVGLTPLTRGLSVAVGLLALSALPVAWSKRTRRRAPRWRALTCVWLAAAAYVPFVIVSHTFFDAAIPFNYRLLLPLLPPAMIYGFVLALWLTDHVSRTRPTLARPVTVAAASLALAVTGGRVVGANQAVDAFDSRARGYASSAWTDSPLIARLRTLPPGAMIFTNSPDAVYYLTGRVARGVPVARRRISDTPNKQLRYDVREMAGRLAASDGRVVYFDKVSRDGLLVSEDDLVHRLDLRVEATFPDGTIYALPE